MYQIPATVWNQLANASIKNPQLLALMKMDQQALDQAMEAQSYLLIKTVTPAVAVAYQIMMIPYLEREVLGQYLTQTGQLDLLKTLAIPKNLDEATAAMILKYRLNEEEQQQFKALMNN